MALAYKVDILHELKAAGYSTYKLRTDKILGEATIQKLRKKEPINWANIEKICELLNCQPSDFIEYIRE